jgi:ribosomal protein S18 acetylase RimI-like enzyme
VISVRPYRPEDRDAVRRICFETGFMGEPCDWYWRDFESFADMWTAYYTDQEPQSAFVAVDDTERVVGYVVGCVDSTKAPTAREALGRHLFRRMLLYRPGTARFLWRGLVDSLRDRNGNDGELHDPRWPSHLHINLLPEGRGQGAGATLMDTALEHLRAEGSPGCHLGTLGENAAAIAFFESLGFSRHGPPTPVAGMRTRDGERMSSQLMTKSLTGSAPDAGSP